MTFDFHKLIRTAAVVALVVIAAVLVHKLTVSIDSVTKAFNDQRRLLDVETSRRAALTQETRANLNCPAVGATLGEGKDSIKCTKAGILPALAESIAAYGNGAAKATALLAATNRQLNNPRNGLLPTLAFEIHANGERSRTLIANADANINGTENEPGLIPLATAQVVQLSGKTQEAIDEFKQGAHGFEQLTNSGDAKDSLHQFELFMTHLDGFMANGEHMAEWANRKVTAPTPKPKQALNWLYLAAKFATLGL